jgi:hypothetical protein
MEYIKTVAAIKVLYSSELGRKTADNKTTLGGVLERAVQWRHIEYCANGSKWRVLHQIDRETMAAGTVGNEGKKAWSQNLFKQTRERAVLVLKAWGMSKNLRHEASFYSPMPLSWGNSGCEWLSRVLVKADNPSCLLREVPATRRVGNGHRDEVVEPSVTSIKREVVAKRPAKKRPASSSSQQRFRSVWKRLVRPWLRI